MRRASRRVTRRGYGALGRESRVMKVKRIYWLRPQGDILLEASPTTSLDYVVYEDSAWILETVGGREVARHNVKDISSIEWAEP